MDYFPQVLMRICDIHWHHTTLTMFFLLPKIGSASSMTTEPECLRKSIKEFKRVLTFQNCLELKSGIQWTVTPALFFNYGTCLPAATKYPDNIRGPLTIFWTTALSLTSMASTHVALRAWIAGGVLSFLSGILFPPSSVPSTSFSFHSTNLSIR